MIRSHAFSRVPNKGDKFKSGYITPAFLGAQKWTEMLHNPCILGGTGGRLPAVLMRPTP